MFRILCNVVRRKVLPREYTNVFYNLQTRGPLMQACANYMKEPKDHGETDDEYDERMECFFTRPEIDGWELRMALTEMAGMDAVPDPKVLIAALCACRRVNDYAMTVRILEMVKFKCGPQEKVIYPWILKNIETVMEELGIDTPERLGYGQPELYMPSVYDMH